MAIDILWYYFSFFFSMTKNFSMQKLLHVKYFKSRNFGFIFGVKTSYAKYFIENIHGTKECFFLNNISISENSGISFIPKNRLCYKFYILWYFWTILRRPSKLKIKISIICFYLSRYFFLSLSILSFVCFSISFFHIVSPSLSIYLF